MGGAGTASIAEPPARVMVVFAATLVDALVFQWLAAVFDLRVLDLSPFTLASRASMNAVVGAFLFEVLDRRVSRSLAE